MEQRNLAPSTIDRRLSTVCGLYRFAHIDGRVGANPAQYVRRPRSTFLKVEVSTAESLGRSSTPPSGLIRAMPPWPRCSGSMARG